jgi:hypothetical protein
MKLSLPCASLVHAPVPSKKIWNCPARSCIANVSSGLEAKPGVGKPCRPLKVLGVGGQGRGVPLPNGRFICICRSGRSFEKHAFG